MNWAEEETTMKAAVRRCRIELLGEDRPEDMFGQWRRGDSEGTYSENGEWDDVKGRVTRGQIVEGLKFSWVWTLFWIK